MTTETKVEAVALSIKPAVFYVRTAADPVKISGSTGFPSYSCVAAVTLAEHEQIVAVHASAITALEGEVADLRERLTKQRRELGREADEAGAELARVVGISQRALDALQAADRGAFDAFVKAEYAALTKE